MSYIVWLEGKEDIHARKSADAVVLEAESGSIYIHPDHLEVMIAAVGLLRALREERRPIAKSVGSKFIRVPTDSDPLSSPNDRAMARRVEDDGDRYDDRDQT